MSGFRQNTTSLEHPLAFIRMLVDRTGATLLHVLLRSVDETGSEMAGLTSDELGCDPLTMDRARTRWCGRLSSARPHTESDNEDLWHTGGGLVRAITGSPPIELSRGTGP